MDPMKKGKRCPRPVDQKKSKLYDNMAMLGQSRRGGGNTYKLRRKVVGGNECK